MFFVFSSLIWMLFGLLTFVCGYQAFHCPPARRRKKLEEMGKPQMSPASWSALAGLCLLASVIAGCAMVLGPDFVDKLGILGPAYDRTLFESPNAPGNVQ